MDNTMPRRIIVMGVSGCGKSTIGQQLADKLDLPFFDGDDLHPSSNIEKMKSGTPLNDQDRQPWLESVVKKLHGAPSGSIIACSALKLSYREILRSLGPITIVYLNGSVEVLSERLDQRAQQTNHFMPSSLLTSQLETLENPSNEELTITVDIDQPVESIVDSVVTELNNHS